MMTYLISVVIIGTTIILVTAWVMMMIRLYR